MNFKLSKLADYDGDVSQRWYVVFYYRDPDTQKWVKFRKWISASYITRAQRYEKAKEIRKAIDLKLQQGWDPITSNNRGQTTIEKAVEYFLESKGHSIRYRTMISYRSHLKFFTQWLKTMKYEKMAIEGFSFYMADDFMDWISSLSRLSNRTWNNYLQTLRCLFNFLVAKEYIIVNPFLRIHERQTEQTELIAFSRDELDLISSKLPEYNHDLYVIALLIFNCFLRPQEIVRIQVRMFKNIGENLSIPGSVSKNKKNESISIPSQLRKEIQKMNLDCPGDWYIFGLHLDRNSKQIAPTRIAETWKKFALMHGIEKNIYGLKHTGNGMALAAGANARDLQLQNRHSSLEETQKYLERFSKVPSRKFVDNFPKL